MEKKTRSVFGLIVAIFVALDAVLMYSNVSKAVSSQSSGAAMLGAALGMQLVRPFLTCAAISAIAALIGFFERWKWGYLAGAIVMVVGILQLPAIMGVPTEPAILVVLMFVAFLIDNSKQKKQLREQAEASKKDND